MDVTTFDDLPGWGPGAPLGPISDCAALTFATEPCGFACPPEPAGLTLEALAARAAMDRALHPTPLVAGDETNFWARHTPTFWIGPTEASPFWYVAPPAAVGPLAGCGTLTFATEPCALEPCP